MDDAAVFGWLLAAHAVLAVILIGYCLHLRHKNKRIERQEMYVAAWREAEESHPGLYTRQLAAEEAKLDAMRRKHPEKPPLPDRVLNQNPA